MNKKIIIKYFDKATIKCLCDKIANTKYAIRINLSVFAMTV